jgi:hypothetical protein
MDGFGGDHNEACLRLQGFLINLNEAFERKGGTPPLVTADVQALAASSTDCSVKEPAIAEVLVKYRAAVEAGGGELYPPLSP